MFPTIGACYSTASLTLDNLPHLVRQAKTEPARLRLFDGTPPPAFMETEVFSYWNEEFLHFWFRGKYDSLRTAPAHLAPEQGSGKTFQLWEHSDVYEVFIGPDARKCLLYREFQVGPDSRWIDIAIDGSRKERSTDFLWNSGMKAHSAINSEKRLWESHFAIPFAAFSEAPRKGDCWNANFYRISGRRGEEAYLSWSPVFKVNFHQPACFGDIMFL
jgi:hypothetical protein